MFSSTFPAASLSAAAGSVLGGRLCEVAASEGSRVRAAARETSPAARDRGGQPARWQRRGGLGRAAEGGLVGSVFPAGLRGVCRAPTGHWDGMWLSVPPHTEPSQGPQPFEVKSTIVGYSHESTRAVNCSFMSTPAAQAEVMEIWGQ